MPERADHVEREREPFPPWLRELCYFGGIIVALAMFLLSMKSDQRSTSEKLDRVVNDVSNFSSRLSAIEQRLPNKEADDLKLKTLEEKVNKNRGDMDFAFAKIDKWREDVDRLLIKKGIE